MGLVNYSIPNLIGGVSQQAASVRHPAQVEVMENMIPSVASGLRRRAGSMHRAKLIAGDHKDAYVHAINRGTDDPKERYFVVVNNADLQVYDYNGTQLPVSFPNGKTYLGTNIDGTLATSPSRDTFSATSVADYTFIVNKNVAVAMGATGTYTPPPQTIYCVVKLGVAQTTYYVNLGGTTFSTTTDATSFKTLDIQNSLVAAINAGGVYTAVPYENMFSVTKIGGGTFTWSMTDTYGGQATFAFSDQVNRYEQLPQKFVEGPVIRVRGDPNNADSSFYVTWKRQTSTGTAVWVETIAPGLQTQLSAATMPHILVRNADNSFTFKEATWDPRDIGDDKSNPVPSFVGAKINDVFFYRNRLGLLADENVVLSRAGGYFDFFGTSARAVTDDDPIDISASTTKVTILRHALPFNKQILIFSDQQQFVLSGDPIMKPGAAKLDPTTAFAMESLCKPVAMGRTVFFPTPRGDYTAIREYYYDGQTVNDDAVDTTAHVPAYVPAGVYRLAAVPPENMVLALSTQERNAIYVYNSLWNSDQKVQSAWHKWVYDPADIIIAADAFNSRLITITQRADGCYLDEADLSEQAETFILCMDRLVAYGSGVYNAAQKMTFWGLPYAIPEGATIRVVIGRDPDTQVVGVPGTKVGKRVPVSGPSLGAIGQGLIADYAVGMSVGLKGNYANKTATLGVQFASKVRLSEQFMRDQKNNAIVAGRMQLRDLTVQFNRTGFFEVRVYPNQREMQRYVYSGQALGLGRFILGKDTMEKESFRAPIMCGSKDCDIDIYNDTHLPMVLLSAEVQASFVMQAGRR